MLVELSIGITLAGITILLIQVLPLTVDQNFYAIALITAALIYVCFSIVSQNTTWILTGERRSPQAPSLHGGVTVTELLGVIIFSIIAVIGIKISPWFLAMGWLIHPAWDLLIDNHNLNTFVPQWYPTVCIGYDIAIALYIAYKCSVKEENNSFLN
jgi:hypothetical protein